MGDIFGDLFDSILGSEPEYHAPQQQWLPGQQGYFNQLKKFISPMMERASGSVLDDVPTLTIKGVPGLSGSMTTRSPRDLNARNVDIQNAMNLLSPYRNVSMTPGSTTPGQPGAIGYAAGMLPFIF